MVNQGALGDVERHLAGAMMLAKRVVAVLTFSVVLIWLTWPSTGQIDLKTCLPNGLVAKISSEIYGVEFWRVQLVDIARRRRIAENWDKSRADMAARTMEILRKSEAEMDAIYRKYPSLAPTDAQIAARALRKLADEIEAAERDNLMREFTQRETSDLERCERTIIALTAK